MGERGRHVVCQLDACGEVKVNEEQVRIVAPHGRRGTCEEPHASNDECCYQNDTDRLNVRSSCFAGHVL
jgi:hypothetical protein